LTSGPVAGVRTARKSALLVAIVLEMLVAFSVWRGHETRAVILTCAVVALVCSTIASETAALAFYRRWMQLAMALGWVNTRIILGLMYYGVFTPLGFFRRLAGRDPLRRRGPASDSYWIPRARPRQEREQFERLF
jgi:hypothetical protein